MLDFGLIKDVVMVVLICGALVYIKKNWRKEQ